MGALGPHSQQASPNHRPSPYPKPYERINCSNPQAATPITVYTPRRPKRVIWAGTATFLLGSVINFVAFVFAAAAVTLIPTLALNPNSGASFCALKKKGATAGSS